MSEQSKQVEFYTEVVANIRRDPSVRPEVVAKYERLLELSQAGWSDHSAARTRDVEAHRPAGGAVGANQYGTFQVRYASPKQVKFAERLLAERIVPTAGGEQVALAAFRAGTANLRQTSDLISWLLTLPERPVEQVATRPASEKQAALINRLWSERAHGLTDSVRDEALANIKHASALIDTLFAAPKVATPVVTSEPEAGVYRRADGTLIRVYLGQQSGRMLAKQIVGNDEDGYSFEYLGAATRFVGGATKLTLDEAKAWGKATGTCCVCARRLDVPESVDAGIGPKCAGRL